MNAIKFEIFDADPNQSGDCGWNVNSEKAGCTSREEIIEWAREQARESGEYDPTDRLWYRIDDGDDEGLTGSFLVVEGMSDALRKAYPDPKYAQDCDQHNREITDAD